MGCFSWLFCDRDNKENLRIDRKGHLLCPDGTVLTEPFYEGYGVFAGQDAYALVADWNREYLAAHPEFRVPRSGIVGPMVSSFDWYPAYANLSLSREEVVSWVKFHAPGFFEYRFIGIDLACGDERNAALPYPLKITKALRCQYANLPASKQDPEQGMGVYHPEWNF